MFGKAIKQYGENVVGKSAALLAVLFLFSQLLISVHHTGDAHEIGNAEDGLLVECDICTVSPSVFDTGPKPAPVVFGNRFQTPPINWYDAPSHRPNFSLNQSRAPPAIS